jgi:hypothetical protein
MTTETRAAIADVVLVSIAAFGVYYVVRTPPLRRATWRLLKYGLFTAAPTVIWQEATRAWAESAHQTRNPELATRSAAPGRNAQL